MTGLYRGEVRPRSIESIPGFLGWFDEGQAPPGAFTLGFWGVRRIAAFDSEAGVAAASEIDVPKDHDPIQEMRIEVFTYYRVKARVDGLYSGSREVAHAAWQLLDPDGRWSHLIVSRAWRVFASRKEAVKVATRLQALGLPCEIQPCEDYLTPPGIICEDERTVREEVERRRASGGALHPISLPARLQLALEGYEP